MKSTASVVALSFLLIGIAVVCLLFGLIQRRMAIAREDFSVFDFVDPEKDYQVLQDDLQRAPWLTRGLLDEIQTRRAELRYWQRDYAGVAAPGSEPAAPDARIVQD